MTYKIMALWLLGMLLLNGACTKLKLEHWEPTGYAEVHMRWEDGVTPSGSRFWFFPVDGGTVLTQEGTSEGFTGSLPAGDYRVIAVNLDAQHIGFRNMESYETAEVYVLPEDSSDPSCISQPAQLYLATSEESAVLRVPDRDTVRMDLYATSRIRQLHLLFSVDNTTSVTTCSGQLTGVASSIFCSQWTGTGEPATLGFTATSAGEPGKFQADLSILDLILPEDEPIQVVDLSLSNKDGHEASVTVDLTEAILEKIETSGGTLPDEISLVVSLTAVDGKLQASVKPWDSGGTGSGDI